MGSSNGHDIQQQDAEALEAGYTQGHRIYEISGIALAVVAFVALLWKLLPQAPLSGWWVPLAALIGILFADFISGFVHWLFDTWGAVDTPVVGALAIRTFRHHHVDQKAITRHDFVETNGHNIGLSNICSAVGLWTLFRAETVTLRHVFIGMACVFAALFVAMTSQIHKWAHQDRAASPIALLQRARIILSPRHHAVHHSAPYNRNYCITVGWMNGPLRAIRFFETLERVITAVTGAIPRADDIGEGAAILVAAEGDVAVPVSRVESAVETRDVA